ncbi:rRNA pseudouridine synthase [Staphylococcus pseudintermedius]|uniref:Pseudouridine synthase n=1 Tax=Staphylococcus pseudintermedius TaxID=283734 RepID=A0A2A4EKM5_STAPS|nr:pseudouridine synthase [Staphylococcus pseudintermedius]ADV06048.1 Ribosomal small subunit pseudouridine synthase A [Staphylococcus pseudintermedius HKU10-03]ADX76312.1 ribosomal small subunit pseudouridine synthase A [Staphylococcus pseudintermedius ED99]ANQ81503.1 16S rRNA pseudouridine(516) synthase [Staphylococcus pseudintermedius]ANQ88031.1 16S rRNA pseudouridine(516) synthase [Staphylococcus pseudintermedius]ASQ50329.1 pseudouridine synthase [Staphylococcus pseudintermedius]
MRIDKFLAQMGVGTRTEVKALLKKGHVLHNGAKIKSSKTQIDPEHDVVEVKGRVIAYEPFVYLMMNKPQNVISATVDDQHQTVIDIIEGYRHLDLFPVGRLDKDTEGLLLITNDGQFNHALMNPNKHVSKTYWVKAKYALKTNDPKRFEEGITLKEGRLQPAHLEILDDSMTAFVTIQEGKYHQVKRMFHAIDNEVVGLKRVSIGDLTLDSSLSPGAYRSLTEDELKLLNYR